MSASLKVHLAGFDAFEQTTFESFFRLATRRDPAYEVCESATDVGLLIVNGDNRDALIAVLRHKRPEQQVLLVGASAEPVAAGLPVHQRPVRFMGLLAAVDKLMAPRAPAPAYRPGPAFAATEPFAPLEPEKPRAPVDFAATQPFMAIDEQDDARASSGFADTQPFMPAGGRAAPPPPVVMPRAPRKVELITEASLAAWRRPAPEQAPAAPAVTAAPAPEAPVSGGVKDASSPAVVDVMLVDASDHQLNSLFARLNGLGLRISMTRSGTEALEALPRRNYRLVFLARVLEDMDGFKACRAIKSKFRPDDGRQPVVVVLDPRRGLWSRLRAALAGADACLRQPMDEHDLKKILKRLRMPSPS